MSVPFPIGVRMWRDVSLVLCRVVSQLWQRLAVSEGQKSVASVSSQLSHLGFWWVFWIGNMSGFFFFGFGLSIWNIDPKQKNTEGYRHEYYIKDPAQVKKMFSLSLSLRLFMPNVVKDKTKHVSEITLCFFLFFGGDRCFRFI